MTVDSASSDSNTTLRAKVASGVRWGIIISIVTQVTRMLFLVVLMRLLGPQNFGIVAQASIFIAIGYLFVHFGLATNIVQRPQLEHARDDKCLSAHWLLTHDDARTKYEDWDRKKGTTRLQRKRLQPVRCIESI